MESGVKSPAAATFNEAFEQLKQSVSLTDAKDFQSTTLADVWNAARAIECVQRERASLRNLRRIGPFLEAIGKYSGVIEVLCQGTPFLPWIWVGILSTSTISLRAYTNDLIVTGSDQVDAAGKLPSLQIQNTVKKLIFQQLASEHSHIFSTLIDAYAQIAEALPRFDRFQKAFDGNSDFQNILAALYAEILEFHRRAYKFFRRRGMLPATSIH